MRYPAAAALGGSNLVLNGAGIRYRFVVQVYSVEPEFFKALMRIWLGPNPADDALKEALLGRERSGPAGRQR